MLRRFLTTREHHGPAFRTRAELRETALRKRAADPHQSATAPRPRRLIEPLEGTVPSEAMDERGGSEAGNQRSTSLLCLSGTLADCHAPLALSALPVFHFGERRGRHLKMSVCINTTDQMKCIYFSWWCFILVHEIHRSTLPVAHGGRAETASDRRSFTEHLLPNKLHAGPVFKC